MNAAAQPALSATAASPASEPPSALAKSLKHAGGGDDEQRGDDDQQRERERGAQLLAGEHDGAGHEMTSQRPSRSS